MRLRDATNLLDILNAAKLVRGFVAGRRRPDLDADLLLQSGVAHQLTIIGEATKRLSPGLREAHPAVPWRRMAGMRDVLVHAYDAVDLDEVWRVASESIPEPIGWIEPLIPPEEA